MAKLSQGINGPFSGKVGAVVGYTWKGIPVMRGRPSPRTKPFTPKELNQQAKFRIMNRFLRPANSLLNITFAHLAIRMSAFNKAFSYNIKNAITGVSPNLSPAVSTPSTGLLQFTWTDNSGKGNAKATDKAFVAVFSEELGNWDYRLDLATRSQEKCEMVMMNFPSKSVQTFIGFISADGKDASDSLYTGLANAL